MYDMYNMVFASEHILSACFIYRNVLAVSTAVHGYSLKYKLAKISNNNLEREC